MMQFDGFIVRDDCVASVDAVRSHPKVKNLLMLPRNWLLYEFHDELFRDSEFLVEPAWNLKMQRVPALKQARIEMIGQQRALLAPWYAKKKKLGDADAGVPSPTCMYRVCTLGSMRWLPFQQTPGWDSASKFTLQLDIGGSEPSPILVQLINEWLGASAGEITASDGLRSGAGSGILDVISQKNAGHWIAVMWVLLSDGRWKNGVAKMNVVVRG
jgi:hypothetical protein